MAKVFVSILWFVFLLCGYGYGDFFSYCQYLTEYKGFVRFGYARTDDFYGNCPVLTTKPSSNAVEYALINSLNLRIGAYRSEPLDSNILPNLGTIRCLLLEINKNAEVILTFEPLDPDAGVIGTKFHGILNDATMFFDVADMDGLGFLFYYAVDDNFIYALLSPYGKQIPIRFKKFKDMDKANSLPQNRQVEKFNRLKRKSSKGDMLKKMSVCYKCEIDKFTISSYDAAYYSAYYLITSTKPQIFTALLKYGARSGVYTGSKMFQDATKPFDSDYLGLASITENCVSFCKPPPDYKELSRDMFLCDIAKYDNLSREVVTNLESQIAWKTVCNNGQLREYWIKRAKSSLKLIFNKCEMPNVTFENFDYYSRNSSGYFSREHSERKREAYSRLFD